MNANDGPNPYASPSAETVLPFTSEALGEPLAEVEVTDMLANQKPWKLLMFGDVLRFDADDDQPPIDILRNEVASKAVIHDALFLRRCMQVNVGKQKVFQFSEDDFARLTEWIGPLTATDLKLALKRRIGWVFPIGLFFIITALPLSGDPTNGVEALPFDPINCGLGVSLCIISVAAKLKPHRLFFLLDSLWFLSVVCKMVYDILSGSSWWWLLLVLLQMSLVVGGIKQYRRFAGARPDLAGEPAT